MRSLLWFSQPKEFKHLHLHLPPPPYHQTTTTPPPPSSSQKNGVTTEEWNATKKPQKNIPRKLNTASSLYHHQNYFTLFLCVFNETLSNFFISFKKHSSSALSTMLQNSSHHSSTVTHSQSTSQSLSLREIVFVGLAELFFLFFFWDAGS